MTSPAIPDYLKLNPANSDIPELQQPVSADSEDSGASDTEVIEVPISEDLDYQESLSTILAPSSSATPTTHTKKSYRPSLPQPPERPAYWVCEPAWHWDKKESPVNSDGEEINFSDMEDSEDGAIPEPVLQKGKGKKKRKSAAKKKQEEDFKKQKVEETLDGHNMLRFLSTPIFMLCAGGHVDDSHQVHFNACHNKLENGITVLL